MIKSMGRQTRNLYLAFILFSLVLSFVNMLIVERFYSHNIQYVVMKNAESKSKERAAMVHDYLKLSEQNISYLRKTDEFNNYIKGAADKSDVVKLFYAYAEYNNEIMQIRYIDKNGMEKVRVDRDAPDSSVYIVDDNELQDKSDRYYFSGSLSKELEKVWYTQIDFNVENGVIVEPHIYTLRTILPVSVNGSFDGILVVNQFANGFIERLARTPLYDSIVFNDAGDIIYHYDKDVHLGEYSGKFANLKDYYPEVYRDILNSDMYKTKSVVSRKLDVPVSGGLNIMLQLKKQYMAVQKTQARNQYILISAAIFLFSALFAYFIVNKFSYVLLNFRELKRLHARLKNSSIIAKIGFWEIGANGKIIWSDGAYDIFEIEDKNTGITLEKFMTYLNEEDAGRLMERYQSSIDGKYDYFCDHAILTDKGNIKYVEERAKHEYDSSGNYLGSSGSVYDITERYLAGRRYKIMLELASDGIFIMDCEGRLVEFSNAASDMLGYTHEEMLNLTVFDWDKEISSEEFSSLIDMLEEGRINIDRVHTRKDGTVYNAQITSTKINLNGSTFLYASVRDVTEKIESEEKIIKQRDEMEAIFDTALEGIAIVDLNGIGIKFNKKYTEILGYKEEELVGRDLFGLANVTYADKAREIFREVGKKGFYENFERNYTDLQGNVKRLKSSLVLLPNKKDVLVTTVEYTELYNAYKQIEEQSMTDELTKLYNRKAFNIRIAEMLAEFKRYKSIFSVIMLDIDRFKSINDTYGHDVGDAVLSSLGKMLKASVRENDYAFRLGGEEFLVILSNTDIDAAVVVAEHIREKIERDLNVIDGRVITSSFGVCEVNAEDTVLTIYKRADSNLYKAKENGRNRVESD